MAVIQNQFALGVSILFFLSAILIAYLVSRKEGYGDFSVGISLLDLYSVIITIVPLTASAAYFMMSLGLGEMQINGITVHWLRYFEWLISTPFLIAGIAILTLDKKFTLKTIFLDFIMVITGFVAVISLSPVKEVNFAISSLAYLFLAYLLLKKATEKVSKRPKIIRDQFRNLRNFTLILWALYPVLWILGIEGLGFLGPTTTFRGFAVLDIVSKIGYAVLVLNSVDNLDIT